MAQPLHHRPLHRAAVALTIATFPLIFMGGLVTTHGAGMAVPDWPNSYGYNMFTFPPSQWVGGIWYEHVHRLMGCAVGFLAIIVVMQAWGPSASGARRRKLGIWAICLAALAGVSLGTVYGLEALRLLAPEQAKQWHHAGVGAGCLALILAAAWTARRPEHRRWVRWLAVAVLVAVCIQGLLGGLRVTKVNQTLAIVHGCFAHAFLCLAAVMALVTSPVWHRTGMGGEIAKGARRGRGLVALGIVGSAAIVVQLVLGATMRHHGAGLAIPDLPWAYGRLLPPISTDGLARINQYRAWELHEKPVTLWQVWLHFGHRIGGVLISVLVLMWVVAAWRSGLRSVRAGAVMLLGALSVQFVLGLLTVAWKKPADIASLHVAGGALLLMAMVLLTIGVGRLYQVGVPAAQVSSELAGAVSIRKVKQEWSELQPT
ncbi:MAG: COX15/CtaA family protein [Phycisphaerales bacterium]|nr:COX15/CtaA family protein [Phycisphaerales bacterium]